MLLEVTKEDHQYALNAYFAVVQSVRDDRRNSIKMVGVGSSDIPVWVADRMRNARIFEFSPWLISHLATMFIEPLVRQTGLDLGRYLQGRASKSELEALARTIFKESEVLGFPEKLPFDSCYFSYGVGVSVNELAYLRVRQEQSMEMLLVSQLVTHERVITFLGERVANDEAPHLIMTKEWTRESGWMEPYSLSPWILPWVIDYVNDHLASVEDIRESFAHRMKWRQMTKRFKTRALPPLPYYVVPIRRGEIKPRKPTKSSREIEWQHRWDVEGHERMIIRRGRFPLDPKKYERYEADGFQVFTSGKLSSRVLEGLMKRGKPNKQPDEWMAVKFLWIKDRIQPKNRPDLPYVPAVRRAQPMRTKGQ